jgi:methyl-accepting chemotaxis protein
MGQIPTSKLCQEDNVSVQDTTAKFAVRRKLVNYLLNPSIQLKFGLYAIGLAIIFLAAISTLFYFHFAKLYTVILELTDLRDEMSTLIHNYLLEASRWTFVIVLLYIALNILFSILLSHRLVGPTIAFRRHIQALIKGNYTSRIRLRKHDAFAEVAADLNKLAEVLHDAAQHTAKEALRSEREQL